MLDHQSESSQKTPFKVKWLVKKAKKVTPEDLNRFSVVFADSLIGSLKINFIKDLKPASLEGLSKGRKLELKLSGSTIVDVGPGVRALVDAVPQKEQEFSTTKVIDALHAAGLIPKNKLVMKMGTSGAVIQGGHAAEGIELMAIENKNGNTITKTMAQAAWINKEGSLRVTPLNNDKRVLVENIFLTEEKPLSQSQAIFLEVGVEKDGVNLYKLLAQSATAAELKDYTIRGTIKGPVKIKTSVVRELPQERMENMDDVKKALKFFDRDLEKCTFHFTGTRSHQKSRRDPRWKKISKDPVYAPFGHIHGYCCCKNIGGHIIEMRPKKGAVVKIILEPARMVELVKK